MINEHPFVERTADMDRGTDDVSCPLATIAIEAHTSAPVPNDEATLDFMADRGARAQYVTSVCSGSLILGKAGLLQGYKATSHWSCRDALAGFGAIPTEGRVVRDRNRITGAGVTAGLDFGLTMVAELRDQTYAECCQLTSEYDPDPPFHAGSLRTASPNVRQAAEKLLGSFRQEAEMLAGQTKA